MKKLSLAVAALLVASSMYASCGEKKGYEQQQNCKGEKSEYCNMKKHHQEKHSNHHKGDSSRFIIGAVYALDLSDEQKEKVDAFMVEYQNSRTKAFEAFKEDSFDKEAYIKARITSKEDKIKAKADLIEKIYGVLTKEQKTELKQELDDFKKLRETRLNMKGCYDKSCNGRG